MSQGKDAIPVVMLGASGAVGGQTLSHLLPKSEVSKITLLGRSPISDIDNSKVFQQQIDIFDTSSYEQYLSGHEVAICTLGVGQPSKISKEEFVKIDKDAVLDFGRVCKEKGIKHFELLASVQAKANSSSFYLRTKGELIEGLKAMQFDRLSIFEPSMILTPTNRYGFWQGVTLLVWPLFKPLFFGNQRKFRGIKVEQLGRAMALNIFERKAGEEHLQWDNFMKF